MTKIVMCESGLGEPFRLKRNFKKLRLSKTTCHLTAQNSNSLVECMKTIKTNTK